jgi:hypothetical protein
MLPRGMSVYPLPDGRGSVTLGTCFRHGLYVARDTTIAGEGKAALKGGCRQNWRPHKTRPGQTTGESDW